MVVQHELPTLNDVWVSWLRACTHSRGTLECNERLVDAGHSEESLCQSCPVSGYSWAWKPGVDDRHVLRLLCKCFIRIRLVLIVTRVHTLYWVVWDNSCMRGGRTAHPPVCTTAVVLKDLEESLFASNGNQGVPPGPGTDVILQCRSPQTLHKIVLKPTSASLRDGAAEENYELGDPTRVPRGTPRHLGNRCEKLCATGMLHQLTR